jgi:hypothetical protein
MIGLQLGTLIAQVVIIGDLGPAIVSKATGLQVCELFGAKVEKLLNITKIVSLNSSKIKHMKVKLD